MIIRTLRALVGINSSAQHLLGLPHPCLWPRILFQPLRLSAPSPVRPPLGQSPALLSTALCSHEPHPARPRPQPPSVLREMPDAQG